MWLLKSELENTVEALKGEIWSLNSQLKASILDREQLQDRVVQLDSSLEAEKKRADALDCELSEQTELTEKATRQAAEAENESNRRLAECLEMETRREQVEKAYAQLSDYYSQLQAAYNVIYAQLKQLETERENDSKQQNVSDFKYHELDINKTSIRDSKVRLLQLEDDLHWKQDECVMLRRKVDEVCTLGAIAATPSSRLRIELAILAAKLATRQADVDALFRANAELAHANVRLQNELDQSEDRVVLASHDVFCDGELQVGICQVKRLEAVEKLLNERILCLEDQLLEGEERLQEIEEELADERQKVLSLQKDISVMEKKFTSGRNQQQQLEKSGEVNKICLMQEAKKSTGDLWGDEEFEKIRNELEKTRKELLEQKKLTVLLESSANEQIAANEVERSGHIQEMERIKCELSTVRQELEVAQERLRMSQTSELRAEKQELGWKLEDFQEMSSTEMSALSSKPKAADEYVMTDMREELESVETPSRNLEVVNEQVMEVRRELTEKDVLVLELESSLGEVQRQLEEKELQNSLLKDSEARLLDSVDEFGLQTEKYEACLNHTTESRLNMAIEVSANAEFVVFFVFCFS
ncbi:unnamed protein product [Angiostrongylus costaricensis]|uniref:GRIP domain-containing protein n=1 Tax=Angiostrongylus costaricensis TaxID=334426 RepID=A0A0R3PIR1_ANGCS|nr:unnamed protein product [Angiostrongylus costaricensis]